MSENDDTTERASGRTELTLVTGQQFRVEGVAKDVERSILDAARGSIMELAWLIDAETQDVLGVNPDHVVVLRPAG